MRSSVARPPIPMNATARLYEKHRDAIDRALLEVAASGIWLGGKATAAFVADFAQYVGCTHCLPVANGSDALEIALRAIAKRAGKSGEVITIANAGGYTTSACFHTGLKPVFVDIDPKTQLVDLDRCVDAVTPDTLAIVVTHLFGGVVDVPKLRSILANSGRNDIVILEDCAQAHGARMGEQRVGSLADISIFSFYPTKNLGAMGDAGAILTSDIALHELMAKLAQYGWGEKYNSVESLGRNSRMDTIQANVLLALLPHLDGWNDRRRQIYRQYASACSQALTPLRHDGDYVAHLAVFECANRDEFRAFMAEKGIGTDVHYPILDFDQPGWSNMEMRCADDLPQTRQSNEMIVSIPCFPFLRDEEVQTVCDAITAWEAK